MIVFHTDARSLATSSGRPGARRWLGSVVGVGAGAPIAWQPMTRPLALVLVALLAVAACGSSGEPTGFDQQPVPVGAALGAELGVDGDATLPVVERNFLEGCLLDETPRMDDAADLPSACQCVYDELTAFYVGVAESQNAPDVGSAAYDLFKDLDSDLDDPAVLIPANIQAIIDGCAQA